MRNRGFAVCILCIFFCGLLIGCNNEKEEPPHDNFEETETYVLDDTDLPAEEQETVETCYTCSIEYEEGGYLVNVAEETISLCKECRDELMKKNSFIVFNGEKHYPFADVNLYKDDMIIFEIPEGYEQSTVDNDDEYWKGQLNHQAVEGASLLIGWEDYFDSKEKSQPSLAERKFFSLTNLDDSTIEEEFVEYLAPFDGVEHMIMDLQGDKYVLYLGGNFTDIKTIKDGIIYEYVSVNFDESEAYDEELLFMDSLLVAASTIYPDVDYIQDYFS